MAPEKYGFEDDFPFKMASFQVGAVSFREGTKQKELKQLSEPPETYYQ